MSLNLLAFESSTMNWFAILLIRFSIEICLGLKLTTDWSLPFGLPIGFEQDTNVNGALDNEDCKFRFCVEIGLFLKLIFDLSLSGNDV